MERRRADLPVHEVPTWGTVLAWRTDDWSWRTTSWAPRPGMLRRRCWTFFRRRDRAEDGMHAGFTGDGLASVATERLALRAPSRADLAELHELYADPRVWRADPVTRHTTAAQTERMIDRWRAAWRRDGLGIWVARGAEPASDGRLVGIGGCAVRHGVAWNIGFRLLPPFWGHGYAAEIITAAVRAARRLRPDLPLTAYLLEGNVRSQRTTERAGLRLAWRGPDAGNVDPDAVRLLYADRHLPRAVVQVLTGD